MQNKTATATAIKGQPPQLNIGDKVCVTFESGNKRVGKVIASKGSGHYMARFGRGGEKFVSGISWMTWNDKDFSWKENWHIEGKDTKI